MDLYEPVKLFQAWNKDTGYSLETMKLFLRFHYLEFLQTHCWNLQLSSKFFIFFILFWVKRPLLVNEIFYVLEMVYLTEHSRRNMILSFFTADLKLFVFNFAFFQFFLYGLFTNKARKLEAAESNLILGKFPLALFLSVG